MVCGAQSAQTTSTNHERATRSAHELSRLADAGCRLSSPWRSVGWCRPAGRHRSRQGAARRSRRAGCSTADVAVACTTLIATRSPLWRSEGCGRRVLRPSCSYRSLHGLTDQRLACAPSRRLVVGNLDRPFGTVCFGEPSVCLRVAWNHSITDLMGIAELVALEQRWCKCCAPEVALAPFLIDPNSHLDVLAGNAMLSVRGARTVPPAHLTADGSSSSKSGIDESHSSSATTNSIRAR
jgi:hypothetical protein